MQRLRVPASKFAERSAGVAVVGLGKIGLPIAVQFVRHGRHVIGCDTNPEVVATINAQHTHIQEEPGLGPGVARGVADGMLRASRDTIGAVGVSDVVVVIVPVTINGGHEIDYRALDAATTEVAAGLAPGKLVIYETTLPVGTTSHRLRPMLERGAGLTVGRDFYLAFSPERVSSGRVFHDLAAYPKVVGGIDEASADAAAAFYRSVLGAEVITMANASDAEFVKLIETTYRDVNVALANEYARYADRRGLDVAAAIAAANTQPYSHVHFPGIGVGGHCIPVYPYFLLHDAGDELALARQARVINDQMATYAVQHIEAVTGPLRNCVVLILGVAYRGDVRETAFSMAQPLQSALMARGAKALTHDPLLSGDELRAMGYTPFEPDHADAVRAIILQANHTVYQTLDFCSFPSCHVVLDGRRALSRAAIEALGIRYLSIGDSQSATAAAH